MSGFSRYQFPTQILFGAGAASQTGVELSALGVASALIVTDKGVRGAGLVDPVIKALSSAGVAHAVYDGVAGNPVEPNVDDGIAAYRELGGAAIVAIGGGSAMDVAKLVALRVNHHRPMAEYDDAKGGDAFVTEAVPPIVALPTTAGTGSEVGRSGVVTLAGQKTVIFSPKLLPALAILDPTLTVTMPAHITAATGYDALTHNVEALVARGDHPLCDAIARGGIELVARSLVRAVEEPQDIQARGDMMKASMMGAIAFQKGLGACHSLAHPLSSHCGLHHGLANALCLPEVTRFNLQEDATRSGYAEVARLFTGKAEADAAIDVLAELRAALQLPSGLEAAGVRLDEHPDLADAAYADSCHVNNPRSCSRDDMARLYEACR